MDIYDIANYIGMKYPESKFVKVCGYTLFETPGSKKPNFYRHDRRDLVERAAWFFASEVLPMNSIYFTEHAWHIAYDILKIQLDNESDNSTEGIARRYKERLDLDISNIVHRQLIEFVLNTLVNVGLAKWSGRVTWVLTTVPTEFGLMYIATMDEYFALKQVE